MSVLLLGMASYPAIPAFHNSQSDSISLLAEPAFAQESEENAESEDEENEDAEEEEIKDKEEVEIEAEVEDRTAKVRVEINDEEFEFEFELDSSDPEEIREEIVSEILARTDLTEEQVNSSLELEIEEELEELDDELLEEETESSINVKSETLGNQTQVKVELEFVTNNTDTNLIIDEIIESFALSRDQADSLLEIEQEDNEGLEEEFEVEIETKEGVSEAKVKLRFIVDSTNRDAILDAIEQKTILTAEQINSSLELEVEEAEELEEFEENEIEVEVKKGKAKIKIEQDDQKSRFLLETTNQGEIISFIEQETGFDESQIRAIWEFEIDDEDEGIDEEKLSEHQRDTKENAEKQILKLQQKIDSLENRLQTLLDKLDSGEYFGNVPEPISVPTSYAISFDGTATSLDDDSLADVDGEIFMETLANESGSSKFKVTGGEILIGDTFYDFVMGKARTSSTGPAGEKDTLVLIGQVMSDQGDINTIKLILDSPVSFVGEFGSEPLELDINPKSKIAKQWHLSASGQLSLIKT